MERPPTRRYVPLHHRPKEEGKEEGIKEEEGKEVTDDGGGGRVGAHVKG